MPKTCDIWGNNFCVFIHFLSAAASVCQSVIITRLHQHLDVRQCFSRLSQIDFQHHLWGYLHVSKVVLYFHLRSGGKAVEAVKQLHLSAELELVEGAFVVEVDITAEVDLVLEEGGVPYAGTLKAVAGGAVYVVHVHTVHELCRKECFLYLLLVCATQQNTVGVGDA